MKKIIVIFLALMVVTTFFVGCNVQVFDTTYKFDEAIVKLPDGKIIRGQVESWKDYDDGSDFIQVLFTDGSTYYTHASNVVLIAH